MQLFLPHHYRAKGLWMALTGLTGFAVAANNGLINLYRIMDADQTRADGSYPYPAQFWQVNTVLEIFSVGLVVVGMLALFLAKDPDEFFYKIRLEAIQFAMYTQFLVALSAFAYFYCTPGYQLSQTFQGILGLSYASFLVSYVLRYYYSLYFQTRQH
jgi:hypothetical protein